MDAPPPTPRCPECGTPADVATVRPPWIHRHRRPFQVIALLAFVVFLAVMQARHWPQRPAMTMRQPGVGAVDFSAHRVTRSDLEWMAEEGTPAGESDSLVYAFRATDATTLAPDADLQVALVGPGGDTTDMVRWGWPCDVVAYRYDATWTDAFARTGMSAPNLRGLPGWKWGSFRGERQHRVRGRETLLIMPYRLGGALLVIVAAWWLGRLGVAIACLALKAAGKCLPGRVRLAVPWGMALAALIVVVALSSQRREEVSPWLFPATPWPVTAGTGLELSQVHSMLGQPGADRAISRAILEAAKAAPTTGDTLVYAWSWPRPYSAEQQRGFWPAGAFDGSLLHPNHGPDNFTEPWGQTRWTADYSRGSFSINRTETTGLRRHATYRFALHHMAWPLLGLVAAWLAPAIPGRAFLALQRRRSRTRLTLGQCVRCGYADVRAPAATKA